MPVAFRPVLIRSLSHRCNVLCNVTSFSCLCHFMETLKKVTQSHIVFVSLHHFSVASHLHIFVMSSSPLCHIFIASSSPVPRVFVMFSFRQVIRMFVISSDVNKLKSEINHIVCENVNYLPLGLKSTLIQAFVYHKELTTCMHHFLSVLCMF